MIAFTCPLELSSAHCLNLEHAVNVMGPLKMTRAFLPLLRGSQAGSSSLEALRDIFHSRMY